MDELEALRDRERELNALIMEHEVALSEYKRERREVRDRIINIVIKGQLPLPINEH